MSCARVSIGKISSPCNQHAAANPFRTDIQTAVGLGRMPLFPAFHSLDQDSLPPFLIKSASEPSLSHLIGIEAVDELESNPHHLEIFATIRLAIRSQASATVSPHIIRVLFNTADTCILNCLYGKGEALDTVSPSHGQKRVSALLVAAQIFLYIVLRRVPATSPLIRILCERLRKALDGTHSIGETWAGHYPALLWVSFVGVLGMGAAVANTRTGWYISLFDSTMKRVPHSSNEGFCEQHWVKRTLS